MKNNKIGINQDMNLSLLSKSYPNVNSCLSEIIYLNALLTLPVETIHVISDIHGEHLKLNHIMNNASGNIKMHAERVFPHLNEQERNRIISLVYYTENSIKRYKQNLFEKYNSDAEKINKELRNYIITNINNLIKLFNSISDKYTNKWIDRFFPDEFRDVFIELITNVKYKIEKNYIQKLIQIIDDYKLGEYFIIKFSEIIKNIAVAKLIVLGDLGDRGPSLSKVIEVLSNKKNIEIIWGNHDIEWIGAAAGSEALIANVIRISLRYGNIEQLEKDYSISLNPLKELVKKYYQNDNAEHYKIKNLNLSPEKNLLYAQMHKAISIIQLKLEDEVISRNPQFKMNSRLFYKMINVNDKSVRIDGKKYELIEKKFPTIKNKNELSLIDAEKDCIRQLKQEFLFSKKLREDMEFLINNGKLYHIEYNFLMYHGCIPIDEKGKFSTLKIDNKILHGKKLYDALESKIFNILDDYEKSQDLDLLWYLWCGPNSPIFGKDKMATFERYFIADEKMHKEIKNPYYKYIEKNRFAKSILKHFGVNETNGTIVSGHIVIKTEKGKSPIKANGKALIIDGGFAAAYGDKGYTLILDSHGVYLAEHKSFSKVQEALEQGKDLIPKIITIKNYKNRMILDMTIKGGVIKENIIFLEKLVEAYKKHWIKERNK